ncbi:glycoside hydrolase [Tricholoma matsutake]|nr:glycoside hydrolase [Tricholoma matsutake 945]
MHFSLLLMVAVLAALVMGSIEHAVRDTSRTKYVFAHFLVGIVASYSLSDWKADILLAKEMGIDGFALNIGRDPYTDVQLGYAYAAAASVEFKVFLSFDFSYWTAGDISAVAGYINKYGSQPAQLMWNNKTFVSSFLGDGFDWRSVESQSKPLFVCPNWQPGSLNSPSADCGFSWDAWPSVNNQPIDSNKTTAVDQNYISALNGKPYMMPVSPWFFTHYGPDTFNKNWIFFSDWLWTEAWEQVLQIEPQFVQIITWNDFGESDYIGPLPNNQAVYAGGPNGAARWAAGFPHDAWRHVATAFIKAYKAGNPSPVVTNEELVYYYRPQPKNAPCTDFIPKPTGSSYTDDLVFVTALLLSPATVVIQSGGNTVSIDVPPGVHTVSGPMGTGAQVFTLKRGSTTVMSGTGSVQISSSCIVNNFNVIVGSVMA